MTNEIIRPRSRHSAVCLDNSIIIFGGLRENFEPLATRVIWMYNLYTEEWNKHVIPCTNVAPKPFHGAVGVVINGAIYTFGGIYTEDSNIRNELWTLSKAKRECFTWNFNDTPSKEESPSSRCGHAGWEYAGKLWTFGGWGPSPQGYLNKHGSFSRSFVERNNQLLCYDPTTQKWSNLQCFGTVPSPRANHTCATIKEKVWLFGGRIHEQKMEDFFELTMLSLTWTQFHFYSGQLRPQARNQCTLTVLTDNQLVLHGEFRKEQNLSDTWIMDLTSHSWRQYTSGRDHARRGHTGSSGLSSNVIIFGGLNETANTYEVYNDVFHVTLEPKCLQQLAMQIIYKNQDKLPWRFLPAKLISLLGFPIKDARSDDSAGSDAFHS